MLMKRFSIAVCLLVAACGGDDDEGGGNTTPEPTAYADMNFEQRRVYMTDVVLPEMKAIFVAFDPQFESMSCQTCHGGGALDGTYATPSPDVTPLPPEEEFLMEYEQDAEFARWADFMLGQVWPEMATLLEVDVYDPEAHPDGFSCAGCHTVTMAAAN